MYGWYVPGAGNCHKSCIRSRSRIQIRSRIHSPRERESEKEEGIANSGSHQSKKHKFCFSDRTIGLKPVGYQETYWESYRNRTLQGKLSTGKDFILGMPIGCIIHQKQSLGPFKHTPSIVKIGFCGTIPCTLSAFPENLRSCPVLDYPLFCFCPASPERRRPSAASFRPRTHSDGPVSQTLLTSDFKRRELLRAFATLDDSTPVLLPENLRTCFEPSV